MPTFNDDAIANALRDFADRVESGELEIIEVELHEGEEKRCCVTALNKDDLDRMHKVLDE